MQNPNRKSHLVRHIVEAEYLAKFISLFGGLSSFIALPRRFRQYTPSLCIYLLFSFSITACSNSSQDTPSVDYSKTYPSVAGGTMISAMTAEPSGLIYMVAGESASAAIASNIFNALLKYNANLDLEGDLAEGRIHLG